MPPRAKITVATALLLYALADLAVPGFCHGEDTIPPFSTLNAVTTMQVEQTGGEAPAPSPASEMDDCFCCCWHTIPSIAMQVAAPIDVAVTYPTPPSVHIRLLPNAFFHPPRA